MYVCLCLGITTETVRDAVAGGASTSKQVAAACGAGVDCGRCRRTVRAIIASHAIDGADRGAGTSDTAAEHTAAPGHSRLWDVVKHLGRHQTLSRSAPD